MKKTLIAVAALSAMACSAMAAQVTLSGVVDLGLNYQHVKKTGEDATNSFTMKSGQNSGSRFAFKGSEELGNDVEVGFQLESGFTADDGALQESRIFRRESRLYVKTAFGTLHAGRFGGLDSGCGSLSIFGGSEFTAFGTGWGSSTGKESAILKGISDRYDNSIAYQSPTFAGFTLYLDHSFKIDNVKDTDKYNEGRPSADQYNAAGLKYANGPFSAAFVYSQKNYKSTDFHPDNSQSYSLGVGYDFGVCKLMAAGQYFDMGEEAKESELEKGWGAILSVTAPVAGGKIYASAGYKDAERTQNSDIDCTAWNVGLGYTYSFSKRTTFYTAAGYTEEKTEADTTTKTKTTEVMLGLVHKF